jgi:hypothetical protein
LYLQRSQASRDHRLEQLNSTGEFLARCSLFLLVQAARLDQRGESFDIGLRKNRIVQQFLVAFVAEDAALSFQAPGTVFKDPVTLLMLAVR